MVFAGVVQSSFLGNTLAAGSGQHGFWAVHKSTEALCGKNMTFGRFKLKLGRAIPE
jgi:hypothetical protein